MIAAVSIPDLWAGFALGVGVSIVVFVAIAVEVARRSKA